MFKHQNESYKHIISDLENKLNCLIQNKDYQEQMLGNNQSNDETELILKMKYELEKKDKELKETQLKSDF